jgi:hypothetical protein
MLPSNILLAIQAVAVGEVSIDGLALCCFNRINADAPFWEVAYIRHPNHRLRITVMKMDSNGKPVALHHPPTEIGQDVRSFDFVVTNGSQRHSKLYVNGGVEEGPVFSPKGPDSVDFRWMINFSDLDHGNITGLIRKDAQHPDRVGVTLARIPHSLLYTNEVAASDVILSPRGIGGPGGNAPIGRTNEETRAVIFASQPTDIRIVSDPPGSLEVPPMVAEDGHYYLIAVTNRDRPDGPVTMVDGRIKGDLRHNYDIVAVDGEPRDLWALPRLLRTENGDCNPERISHPNVRTLQPLIEDREQG